MSHSPSKAVNFAKSVINFSRQWLVHITYFPNIPGRKTSRRPVALASSHRRSLGKNESHLLAGGGEADQRRRRVGGDLNLPGLKHLRHQRTAVDQNQLHITAVLLVESLILGDKQRRNMGCRDSDRFYPPATTSVTTALRGQLRSTRSARNSSSPALANGHHVSCP